MRKFVNHDENVPKKPAVIALALALAGPGVSLSPAASTASDGKDLSRRIADAGGGLIRDRSLDVAAAAHLQSIRQDFGRASLSEVRRVLDLQGDAVARVRPFSILGVSAHERGRRILDTARDNGRARGFTHFGLAEDDGGAVALFARRVVAVAPPQPTGGAAHVARGFAAPQVPIDAWVLGPCPHRSGPCSAEPARGVVHRGLEGSFSATFPTAAAGWWTLELVADVGAGPEIAMLRRIRVGEATRGVRPRAAEPRRADPDLGPASWLAELRRARARSALVPDERLARAALAQARAVCAAGWASHRLPGLESPKDRARRAGFVGGRVVEAVALAPSLNRAFENLVDSPAHLAALLDPDVRAIGIGTDVSGYGSCLVVLLGRADQPW